MNDGDWLQQLRSRPLDTLSLDELRQVRRRMSESPEFCEALLNDVSLARVVDALMELSDADVGDSNRSVNQGAGGRMPWRRIWLVLFLLAIPAIIAAWRVSSSDRGGPPGPPSDPSHSTSPKKTAEEAVPQPDRSAPPASAGAKPESSGESLDGKTDESPSREPGPTRAQEPRDKADDRPSDRPVGEPPEGTAGLKPDSSPSTPSPPTSSPPTASTSTASTSTVPPPPWQAVLADDTPPAPFPSLCWEGFDTSLVLPTRETLQAWFETVPGHGLRWTDTRVPAGVCGSFEGVMRLKAPLGGDRVLRLSIDNFPRLQIHLFTGRQGVSLAWCQDDPRWAAYSTERDGDHSLPGSMRLVATDGGRSRRAEFRAAGSWELRHRDGYVTISRGDIVLLRVPLAEAPSDVYFHGRATFYGIALARSADGPPLGVRWPETTGAHDPSTATPLPPPMEWTTRLDESMRWGTTAGGGWSLATDGAKGRGWVAARLPHVGMREIVVQWDSPTVGAGLFLAAEGEAPRHVLRVTRDKRSGGRMLTWCGDDDRIDSTVGPPTETISPFTHESPWVRLVVGCGFVRAWQSGDGVHWAELPGLARLVTRGITQFGLHCVGGKQPVSMTLNHVWIQPLPLLETADASLVSNSQPLLDAGDPNAWEQAVAASRPANVDERAWWRACAALTLSVGTPRNWEIVVLNRWLDSLEPDMPLERYFPSLQSAAAMIDAPDDAIASRQWVDRFREIGWRAFTKGGLPPLSTMRAEFQRASIHLRQNDLAFDPRLVRTELLMRLYAGEWAEAIELTRQLRFFHQQGQTPLLDWADSLARRATPGPDAPDASTSLRPRGRDASRMDAAQRRRSGPAARVKDGWQPVLHEELGKETYNALAELEGLLAADAYDDAARLITQLNPGQVQGLAPLDADTELLASLPVAVSWFAAEYPPLREAVRVRFNNLAPLRLRPALLTGEPSEVELVALQFAGTSAAAEGHQWLGDRALAAGSFPAARAAYRRALEGLPAAQRPALEARLRLAHALLGEDAGAPPTAPVTLGTRTLAVAEFESLVADARDRARQSQRMWAERRGDVAAPLVPRPAMQLEAQSRAPLDGPLGERPQEEVTRFLDRLQIDWAGRQIGWMIDGDTLYVNNRFQIAAYQLPAGQRLWQTAIPESKKVPRSRDWSLVAMSPRVIGKRVYGRLLYGDGPLLGCWDATTGQNVWLADQLQGQHIASDPWIIQDRLVAFTVTRTENSDAQLRLATFDALSGELLQHVDLLELRSSWYARHCCETVLAGDTLIAVLGGAVVACDLRGQLRWVRKQILLPAEEEAEWVAQALEPPLIHGQRLIVAQPGVRSIDCLDLDTGRRLVRMFVPDVRRVAAVVDDSLIVVTDRGIEARLLDSGAQKWERPVETPLHGFLAGGPHGILHAEAAPPDAEKKLVPQLVWLDPATGAVRAKVPLPSLADPAPRLGPLIPHGDRLWTFFGRGQAEARRELFELIYR